MGKLNYDGEIHQSINDTGLTVNVETRHLLSGIVEGNKLEDLIINSFPHIREDEDFFKVYIINVFNHIFYYSKFAHRIRFKEMDMYYEPVANWTEDDTIKNFEEIHKFVIVNYDMETLERIIRNDIGTNDATLEDV